MAPERITVRERIDREITASLCEAVEAPNLPV
jgi:hypothetical protein